MNGVDGAVVEFVLLKCYGFVLAFGIINYKI